MNPTWSFCLFLLLFCSPLLGAKEEVENSSWLTRRNASSHKNNNNHYNYTHWFHFVNTTDYLNRPYQIENTEPLRLPLERKNRSNDEEKSGWSQHRNYFRENHKNYSQLATYPAAEELHATWQHYAPPESTTSEENWFTTTSSCSAAKGCPGMSMVWASGTFTVDELLSYSSFAEQDMRLSLKLSLCCNYLFHGNLLRSEELYDTFLQVLLEGSPFHVLSPEEKRLLFPRERGTILNTLKADKAGKRELLQSYHQYSLLTEEDARQHNDGDGNVLILFTGKVGKEGMKKVMEVVSAAHEVQRERLRLNRRLHKPYSAPHEEEEETEDKIEKESIAHLHRKAMLLVDANIQLRISNKVLKCKCPHTLLVRPELSMMPDVLPPMELVGVGPHCGVEAPSRQNRTTPRHYTLRVRKSSKTEDPFYGTLFQKEEYEFATSFSLYPPPPPSSVVTWVVSAVRGSTTEREEVVYHKRVVPAVLELEQEHNRHDREARNTLVEDSGACPYFTVEPNKKYYVTATIQRGTATPQVLNGTYTLRLPFPRHWSLPPVHSAPHFGRDRWMKLSPQYTLSHPEVAKGLDGRQREVPYYGYWENTPLSGEPLPQQSRRVRHNPYTAPDGDTFPLFVGHNLVGYFVSDVDEVCDPVPLEGHDLWSVQSILLTPSPATACTNSAEVEALQLHRLLHRMRRERGFQVNIRNTSWTSEEAESAVEGRYRCRSRREYDRRRSPNSPVEYDGTCEATPTVMGGLTETTAELSLPRRGVFDVEWIARVVVGNRSLLIKENIDPNVTTVLPAYAEEGEARTDLEIKSNTLIVVRRLHSYPSHVEVELPMYRRRMAVAAPTPTGQLRDTKRVTLQGYWRVRAPLVQMSIDERLQVELDTSSVPNVRRVLPEGSLQFVVQDPGEDLASTHGIPYTSRCPDFGVEYVVRVVALLAPPIVPAYEIVYTEEACVEVEAPRAGHKDEVVRWQVLPCPAAVAPPYMVELPIVDEETDLTVWRACGVEVHHWCEVVWSATNLVGVVNKTYSLRRCERPPEVFFHQNGDQQVEGLPVRYFYPLPIRTEEPSQQTPHAVVPVTDGLEAEWGTLEEVYPGTARRRTILPVAGYEAEFGYSFNTTGKHAYYEANFTPVRLEVACQYNVTKTHYIRLGADVNERICFRPRHHTDDGRLPEEEEGSVLLEEVSNDEKFWSHFNTAQAREEHEADAENYFERRREAIRRRENRLDKVLGDTFTLTHTPLYRRLHYTPLGESTFIPYDYVIRTSRESEVPQEDREQFALRGMCRQREGYTSLFVVNPKGSVELDDRYGTVWPPPAPPAIGVLPFCAPRMIFSRHPDLYKTYMFDYTWTCNESDIITVTKQDPMISTFIHSEYDPDGTGRPVNVNSTNCRLKVYNHATRTMKEDWFLVKRVYPTRFPNSRFIIFGYNSVSTVLSFVRRTDRKGRPLREANAHGEYVVVPTPHKTRRVVGSRVLLHVDSPASPHLAVWAVTAATPHSAKVTSAHMIDLTHFTPHFQSKEALERGKGGATATLSGLEYSGLYTVTHYQPDPVYPNVCPNATLEETLEVFRAEVTLKTAFVCGATASIHAVPIPKEISHQFIGQWEVVSLETAPGEVWTGGPSLSGIRFDHENHGNTLVHGLPFGVLTLRWAIYRLLPDQLETVGGEETEADLEELNRLFGGTDRVNFTAGKESYRRELVDYDDMTVYVITENLLSDQVVTLSDTADILRTSSTVNWVIEHDPSKAVRLSSTPIQNYTLLQTSETEETRNMFEELRERYPYIGKQPRPGTELLTADRLPVGSVKLGYDLQPSRNVFGLMKDHTCSMRGVLHIERVSAFLTANTTMDHECDGYTGRGKITLCLHAERGGHPSSRKERQLSRVRLIPLTEMERTLKKGALEVERKGCSVPWWTWEKTKWENITEVRPMDLPARRCFEFIATAGRHLSPREVSHPLFMSLHGANLPPESEVTCKDFISSRIMEGATHHSRTDPQNVGPHLFPFSSTSQRNTQPYLIPVLETNSLQRLNISMRPMLGDQRMPDEVTTELNVSRGGESVVTLKMDLSAPRRLAGFFVEETNQTEAQFLYEAERHPLFPLLVRCVEGSLHAGEVLQFWEETNRPDGLVGTTLAEWLSYARYAAQDRIPCEVFFAAKAQILPPMQSGGRGWAKGRRTVTLKEDGDAALTSLDAMEREVGVMHPERVFTAEGIDITGLPPDLQKAVRQRRSTKEQYVRLMEERRRQRLEREKKASQQVDVPGGSSSGLSPRERLLAVLASYRASSPEQEVVAIRVKLPGEPQFTVPYDVFLRTALHKDVICGSRVSPTRGPHSLVHFGRLVIKDVPPLFHPPPPVKQCEVEGHIPPVVLHVEGAVFAAESFSSSQIILEEIQNPHLPPIKETAKLGVGLLPCLREMLDGATAIVTRETMKDVTLQLNYCPSFQMLSSDEYDVRVDSEELLRRLQHPRYLRIVIKNALRPDSFTSTTKGNPTDVNVTIEVRPTIARLHLRAGEELLQRGRVPYFPRNTTRPMLVCESTLREEGFELGIELVGDQWTLDHTGRQSSSPWMEEGNDTTEHQKENITSSESTLVNSFSVVGHHGPESTHHLHTIGGGSYKSHFLKYFHHVQSVAQRSPYRSFVNYFNTTFISLLIPSLREDRARRPSGLEWLGTSTDATMDRMVKQVYGSSNRYTPNTPSAEADQRQLWTSLPSVRPFSKVEEILFSVPGLTTLCAGCLLADTHFFIAGDLTGRWTYSASSSVSVAPRSPLYPPPLDNTELARPLLVPWDHPSRVPRTWAMHWLCPTAAYRTLRQFHNFWRPPTVPHAGTPYLQLEVVLYAVRDGLGIERKLSDRPTALMRSVPLPLQEVLRAEDARGFRDSHTPRSITLPVPDREAEAGYTALQADVLRYRANPRHATYQYNRDTPRTEGLLSVNASVMLKLCVPKRQANPPNPSQPVYLSPQEEHHCMIVSITDTVLTVEAPKAAATPSWLRQWLQRLHAGPTKEEEETSLRRNAFIYLWLHNLYIAVAVYVALPKVGLYRYYEVERRGARYTPSADLENREKARVALTIMYFVTLVFTHLYLPELWLLWWCSAWMMRLYAAFDTGVQGRRWGIILFAISAAWYYLSTA